MGTDRYKTRGFCLVKFGTGSTTELTQKCEGHGTKMPYVCPNMYINKYPQFSIELPLIVLQKKVSY